MNIQISTAWEKVQSMINGFFALLPNMVLALLIFAICFIVAGAIRKLVRRLTHNRRHARNLGLILGRLAQWTILLIGLFISLSIVIPTLRAGDLADSTVNIRARWWVKPPRRAEVLGLQDKVLTAIKNKLIANGIDLPFPTHQILFHDQTEETDGDRARQREGWFAGKKEVPKPRSISDSLRKLAEIRSQRDGRGHTQLANDG